MDSHLALRKFFRRVGRIHLILLAISLALLAIRLALPYAVKSYVNHQLNKAKDFTGSVGDITIHLWRGGYQIHHIQIMKRDGDVKSPLFAADKVDLSVEWKELFHGSLVAKVLVVRPRANFVEGPTPQQSQTGKDEAWNQILGSLFPFDINRFEIDDGEIHFQNPQSNPPVDIYTSQLTAVATNLTNARDVHEKLPSGLHATATSIGGGQLNLDLHMNVLETQPAYEVDFGMTNVDLTALNSFLRSYGKFDVAHGSFALYVSVASDRGNYQGYTKIFFKNLDVFAWDKERKKNVLEIFWQAIVAGVAEVVKNHSKDQLAAKVPIAGSYKGATVGIWSSIGSLLRNAFIQALTPKLDQHVTVEQVDRTKKENSSTNEPPAVPAAIGVPAKPGALLQHPEPVTNPPPAVAEPVK